MVVATVGLFNRQLLYPSNSQDHNFTIVPCILWNLFLFRLDYPLRVRRMLFKIHSIVRRFPCCQLSKTLQLWKEIIWCHKWVYTSFYVYRVLLECSPEIQVLFLVSVLKCLAVWVLIQSTEKLLFLECQPQIRQEFIMLILTEQLPSPDL